MLGRVIFGAGASATALLATGAVPVAHAASKEVSADPADKFRPVYDDEIPQTPSPLPGTIEPSKIEPDTRLAETESKIAQKLQVTDFNADGRVYRVSTLLEPYVRPVRQFLSNSIKQADETSSELAQKYRRGERDAAQTLASLKADQEDMLPNSIYVLIAGLTGSIVSRRRNILLRATVPWLFGGVAFAYLLPKTWSNVRGFVWEYEKKQVPTLAEKQAEAEESLAQLRTQTAGLYDKTSKSVRSSVDTVRQKIKEWSGY